MLWVLPLWLSAQLTLKITSLPTNTPANATLYAAGTFNNWNAASSAHIFAKQADGAYTLTISPAVGTVEYKVTRGGWPTVEGNADGKFRPNRTVSYNGSPKTETITIQSWEDLGASGGGTGGGTAAGNVTIIDNNFFIPQLNRNRRIWLYLPPDYATSTKRYPVLYMHDGQNLFDVRTSFSGEWQIDESLNELFRKGDYGCIVVGIDNGGSTRLDEYSPWVNAQYGGGQGDEYTDFIVQTLKPYLDAHYRTQADRQGTAIMGSSMGGLVSMYAFAERQDVFSKAGVFSPAFWFAGDEPVKHVLAHPRQGDGRIYFLAGGAEPASVATNVRSVADAMTKGGFSNNEIYVKTPTDGAHAEWFWAREFPAAYQWLFSNSTGTGKVNATNEGLQVFPNPAGAYLRWNMTTTAAVKKVRVQIVDMSGKVKYDANLAPQTPVDIAGLASGMYIFRVRTSSGTWQTTRFSKSAP